MPRGSGNRSQFAPTVGGPLPSDQFHLLDTPSAGPVLLHIPTSRLFAVSPALSDHIRVPAGVDARIRVRASGVAWVSTSVISKGSREPASGPPEKSRSPALPLPPGEGRGEILWFLVNTALLVDARGVVFLAGPDQGQESRAILRATTQIAAVVGSPASPVTVAGGGKDE